MDPLSITASCAGLVIAIVQTTSAIANFVRDVREARGDLDMISRELLSIKFVLEILAEDTKTCPSATFPASLAKQIAGIVKNCGDVIGQVETCIAAHTGNRMCKGAKWISSGRGDMAKLRSSLEAHKSALDIALDMLNFLELLFNIVDDTITKCSHLLQWQISRQDVKEDTGLIRIDTSAIKEDTVQILQEIARLQAKIQDSDAGFTLHRYLESLTTYAESSYENISEASAGDNFRPSSNNAENLYISKSDTSVRMLSKGKDNELGTEYNDQQQPFLVFDEEMEALHVKDVVFSEKSTRSVNQDLPTELDEVIYSIPVASELPKQVSNASAAQSGSPFSEQHYKEVFFPKLSRRMERHARSITCIDQSDSYVASGSLDSTIRIWYADNCQLAYVLEMHASVHCLHIEEGGNWIIAGDKKGNIRLWELFTGSYRAELHRVHDATVVGLKSNNTYIVSASKDSTAKLWERHAAPYFWGLKTLRGRPLAKVTLLGHTPAITCLLLTEENALIGDESGNIKIFNLATGDCLRTIRAHSSNVVSLAICQEGRNIISSHSAIRIHSIATGERLATLSKPSFSLSSVTVHSDIVMAVSNSRLSVWCWELTQDGEWIRNRSWPTKAFREKYGKMFSEKGYYLITSRPENKRILYTSGKYIEGRVLWIPTSKEVYKD